MELSALSFAFMESLCIYGLVDNEDGLNNMMNSGAHAY